MKTYPKIIGSLNNPDESYIFVKYDGSNIRCEWSKKRGWYKFGSRHHLIDEKDPQLGTAIPLFLEKYGDDLEVVFKSEFKGVDNFIVFSEWFGAKSFAGQHDENDPKDIVLFDVNPYKKGILGPKRFLELFGHLKVAECLGKAKITDEFIRSVRNEEIDTSSKYPIKTEIPEGIICKHGESHKLWMTKVKTFRYLNTLKARFGQDWIKYWE